MNKILGIVFSISALTLLKDNYEKYVKEVRHKMEIWTNKELSLFGKISTVKMMILPKLLFLFKASQY